MDNHRDPLGFGGTSHIRDGSGSVGHMASPTDTPQSLRSSPGNWCLLQEAPSQRPFTTVRRLRRWQYEGLISVAKIGRQVFVDLDELDRLMASHVVEPDLPPA
jgi:hypothetical protein